ncbi:TetR/AcrR family transcriptional regulator [Paraburkholderia sp. J12]|uniref:TetR/AcrR family transcriptional regulator n=1 Tax=Paraburkholderia sp. J12 TaxID=2805432 RepID=UPI002ABE3795|nr:TetR/AcrR family transcriptional regulator [Paraburkholderia sp. J12]
MVDAIVDAAIRVLAARGWSDFTTNEVAEVAGVSVGSLYQYFPDKLALAEVIRQRHLSAVLDAISPPAGAPQAVSLEQRVAQLVTSVIVLHSENHALHRILVDGVPLLARANYGDFEEAYRRAYRTVIEFASGREGDAGDEVAAWVLAAAVEGAVHAAVRSGQLDSPLLKVELAALVLGYLRSRKSEAGSDL